MSNSRYEASKDSCEIGAGYDSGTSPVGRRECRSGDPVNPPGHRWIVLATTLCIVSAAAVMLCNGTRSQPKITDQALLREAVEEWRRAGARFPGPDHQIFEQQAWQGYYDDAMVTDCIRKPRAHHFKRPDDLRWAVVEVARFAPKGAILKVRPRRPHGKHLRRQGDN